MKNTNKGLLLVAVAALLASCGGKSSSSTPANTSETQGTSQAQNTGTSEPLSISEQESLSNSDATSEVPIAESTYSESIDDSSVIDSSGEEPAEAGRIVRFAYHNDDSNEAAYGLWLWADGLNGKLYNWDGPLDENFYYLDLNLSASPFAGIVEDTLYLIVRKISTWDGQSSDTIVHLDEFEWVDDGNGGIRTTIYMCDGAGQTVEMYDEPKSALGEKFVSFNLADDNTALTFTATASPEYVNFYVFDETYYEYDDTERPKHRHDYLKTTLVRPEATTKVTLADLGEEAFNPHKSYCITGAFADNISKTRTKYVDMKPVFDTPDFIRDYTYLEKDLGCTYDSVEKKTTFKVWAPTSARAEVIVYRAATPYAVDKGESASFTNDEIIATIPLTDIGQGVFAASFVQKDLKGYGYVYRLYRDGTYIDAVDPYADACGANGKRAAIVDLSETDPEGFQESLDQLPDVRELNQLTIYETHVRDVTSHETWTGESPRGTYKALAEGETTYEGEPTGFDHIVDMGVNAVQLLPVFDSDNDERTYDRTLRTGEVLHYEPSYNWGYNPVLYNCVEGSYATNPYDPNVRIAEYKQLIQRFADEDIRVIMDVVYNHVASVSSNPFNMTVPGYYFRYSPEGSLIDRTGCSNTLHSYRIMCHRFIVDSVCKWAKNYGVKGFRFDLMAAINFDTMRALKNELYDIDPKIVVYGEPWVGAGGDDSEYHVPGNRWDDVYNLLGDNGKGYVGAFNNGGRDGLKGDTAYANVVPSYGFMNTGSDYMDANIKRRADASFMGWNAAGNDYGQQDPRQTVNYVSCHDNYTLFDQFNWTLRGDDKNMADVTDDNTAALAVEASLATMGATLISEGAAFLQGGDEFFRHKVMPKGVYLTDDSDKELRTTDNELYTQMVDSYIEDNVWVDPDTGREDHWTEGDGIEMASGNWLVRNAYKYGDKVNGFDYSRLHRYHDECEKVKEAIALRERMIALGTLGKTKQQLQAGEATMWGSVVNGENPGDPIVAAYMKDPTLDVNYYILLSGRDTTQGEYNSITIGDNTFHISIDYSSNGVHYQGQDFECTSLGAGRFEFLVCHTI